MMISKLYSNKYSIFICSHSSCAIFVLISYSLDTQVMLILALIDVWYSQKAIFSFQKGSIGQNHSSSGSHCLVKKSSLAKFLIPPTPYHYLENPDV